MKVTLYGGEREIGGNKVLIENKDTRIFLDFGMSFAKKRQYYDEYLKPRSSNGLGDFIEMGLVPDLKGLYRDDLLKLLGRNPERPSINAVFVSHGHADHVNYVSFLNENIPVYVGDTTLHLLNALNESQSRDIEGEIVDYKPRPSSRGQKEIPRDIRTFRTGNSIEVGSMKITPIHVDHSVPGAYGFIVEDKEDVVVYTGDLRLHGLHPQMTKDFIQAAKDMEPQTLICEGTRVAERKGPTENDVYNKAKELVSLQKGFVAVDFNFKDVDRLQTMYKVAKETDRKFLLTTKNACLLHHYNEDPQLKKVLPKLSSSDVVIYMPKKKTGQYDLKDYGTWERPFFDYTTWTADDVRKKPNKVLMPFGFYNLNELIDIKPPEGSLYLSSMSEAFNEEQILDEQRLDWWLRHFHMKKERAHCSGHASGPELRELVQEINPKRIVPIHTEKPELVKKLL